jgi:putative FmdB family regulatory protein
MPIYEYECNQCGEPFEKMVRFSDAGQIPACPACTSIDTRKKISAVVSFGTSGLGLAGYSTSGCDSSGAFT